MDNGFLSIEHYGYYVPSYVKTLVILCISHNVRCVFTLVRTTDLFTTFAKVDGHRLIPYGATQLCLAIVQQEYRIFVKFNTRAVEHMRISNLRSGFYHSDALLIYVSSYNIYIDRPLSLAQQCLPVIYSAGYTVLTISPAELPEVLRQDLLFPHRRRLRFMNSDGDFVNTCTVCSLLVYVD